MTNAPTRRLTLRRAIFAALCFACFAALGVVFSNAASISALDLDARALAGQGVPIALFFTQAGRFPVFAALCVLLLIFGFVRRAYLGPMVVTVVALALAWKVSDFFKDFFHRPRPDYWVAIHETSASYASGHAVLSLTFYGLLAYIVSRSSLPANVRSAAVAVAALWILATGWSRLALGAHYLSDVIGGYLLGFCFLLVGEIVVDRFASARRIPT